MNTVIPETSTPSFPAAISDTPTAEQHAAMIRNAYDHGMKNLEFTIASAECLNKEANTTLNFIGAGGLGALAYTAHLIEEKSPAVAWLSVAAVSIYLLVIAWLVLRRCLRATNIFPPHNEAENLYFPGYTAEEVMLAEMAGLKKRGDFNRERNARVGTALNNLRFAAIFAPVPFAMVWAVARVWGKA